MGIPEKRLKSLLADRGGVLLCYLFGSRGRGDQRLDSDTDLAVLMDHSVSLDERSELTMQICRILQSDAVDVVLLNDAPPLLKYEVVTEGRLVYQGISDEALNDFELRVIKEYFDTEPLRRTQQMYLRERLLEEVEEKSE